VPARPSGHARAGRAGPRRILVMDDELAIRKIAALMLQNIGHTAVTVADGAEAIAAYEAARQAGEPFDAVLMDLTIPQGLGGKETILRLKALDPAVRAIVCSGYSHDPVMASHREHGFAGVMPKPYSAEDLARTLNELFAEDAAPDSPS
jgi:CheY-like chemotaxis protein